MENAWWRSNYLLNENEIALMKLLFKAHEQSVFRDNISTLAVAGSAIGSADFGKSVAAALLTLGGAHAPVEQAIQLLSSSNPAEVVKKALSEGRKIPGWGGSFAGKEGDPLWRNVANHIQRYFPLVDKAIASVTDVLWKAGKEIRPNPACYTAASAMILRIPSSVAVWLFIKGRLDGWTQVFLTNESRSLWV